eukprot:PhM_4_TR14272/c2_g2_i2/m.4892
MRTLTRLRSTAWWCPAGNREAGVAFLEARRTIEFWTDATVDDRRQQLGTGAWLMFADSPDEGADPDLVGHVNAGTNTCSFRAEALTIEMALENLLTLVQPWTPTRRQEYSFFVITDSMSTLAALESGPIDQHEPVCIRMWHTLAKLADLGIHLRLQFVYSHCGALRNEAADAEASRASHLPPVHTSPSWWRDSARYTYTRNAQPEPPATTFWCRGEHVLDPLMNRTKCVRFARIRTESTLEFGTFRRHLGLERTMNCRWCA